MFAFLDSPIQLLILGSLTLLSLADLRFRTLPGIKIFFVAATIFGILEAPWKTLAVLLAVGWGGEFVSTNSRLWFPIFLIIPVLFYPTAWPVILTAAGTRKKLIARGDLFGIGGIACLMGGYGTVLALLGVLIWRRFRSGDQTGAVAALPGMLIGVVISYSFDV